MPRKTRKEKIASAARKQMQTPSADRPVTESPKISPSSSSVVTPYELTAEDMQQRSYFFRDLRKSLILVAVVFTLEFLLYYATMNNYLRFIKF